MKPLCNPDCRGQASRIGGVILFLAAAAGVLLRPAPAAAGGLSLPEGAERGLNLLYSGKSEEALKEFRRIQAAQPNHPLGYLLEAEAEWWRIYCESCEIKWNMIDAWSRPRLPSDDSYFALLDKATALSDAAIEQADSAEMRFYDGMAWAMRARLTGLRGQRTATARAGVRAREHFLRCLKLDPDLTDAYTGLGLYNYYADTLSAMARVLRFFMGIPGGDKNEGIRQLEMAAEHGTVTRIGARFYLAKNLRVYDQNYKKAIELLTPLVAQFPQNPVFQMALADTHAKLNHKAEAAAGFRAAAAAPVADSGCAARVKQIAAQELMLLAQGSGEK